MRLLLNGLYCFDKHREHGYKKEGSNVKHLDCR
jgi:hypothetical protein